jgi:hypothetical protein
MPLTKVSFSVIQVANNVTSTTVGNTSSIPSFTFDQNGVITSASNNAIVFPAGSNTAPSITTSGDTNTGIFFPAADTIAFTEGGVEAMRIDSSGNVGIGNTTPSSFDAFANRLVVGTGSGTQGITIFSGTTGAGALSFADGTSGTASYQGYIFYSHFTNIMGFYADYDANPAARMAISNTGIQTLKTISVGDATPASTGAGITFPATQSASSDANTLDDYEEGTWTPTLTGWSSITYNTRAGTYVKIGRKVTCWFDVRVTAGTNSIAAVQVTGLPFTVGQSTNNGGGMTTYADLPVDNRTYYPAYPGFSTTTVNFYAFATGATTTSNGDISGTKYLQGCVIYEV